MIVRCLSPTPQDIFCCLLVFSYKIGRALPTVRMLMICIHLLSLSRASVARLSYIRFCCLRHFGRSSACVVSCTGCSSSFARRKSSMLLQTRSAWPAADALSSIKSRPIANAARARHTRPFAHQHSRAQRAAVQCSMQKTLISFGKDKLGTCRLWTASLAHLSVRSCRRGWNVDQDRR